MSKPTVKITRTIQSKQVLNAFTEVVRKNLPLDLKEYTHHCRRHLHVLGYANVQRLSIESACQELQDAPSGNRLREVLVESSAGPGRRATGAEQDVSSATAPSLWKGNATTNVAI